MATPAQTAANQANAQFSTGPCSAEGKAAVSQNARKHGLSSHYVMLSEAERPLFEALEFALRQEINPNGALQESIFRELVAAVWKRDIVNRLVTQASQSSEALFDDQIPDRVRKLQRHKADQDRAINRAMKQLKELQTNEVLLAHMEDDSPGLADYNKIAKQTQQRTALALQQIQQEAEALRKGIAIYCQNLENTQQNQPAQQPTPQAA